MYRLILLTFISLGSTHDITVGSNTEGKIIFNDSFQASPAIWRQKQNITINTTDDDVISRIIVTDLREEKDGSAKIVDGGEGQKAVTLELQSPTVFRGYDFHIEVYAVPDKHQHTKSNGDVPVHPIQVSSRNKEEINRHSSDVIAIPSVTNLDATTKYPSSISTGSVSTGAVLPETTRQTRGTESKPHEENKENNHYLFGRQNKKVEALDKEEKNKNNLAASSPRILNDDLTTSPSNDGKVMTPTQLVEGKQHTEDTRQTRDTQNEEKVKQLKPTVEGIDAKSTTTTTKTPFVALSTQSTPPNNPTDAKEVIGKVKADENATSTVYSTHRPIVYTPAINVRNIPTTIGKTSNTHTTEANKNTQDRKDSENKDSDEDEEDYLRAIPLKMGQTRRVRDTYNEEKENTPRVLTDIINNPPKTTNKNSENITDDQKNTQDSQHGNINIPPTFGQRKFEQSSTTVSSGSSSTVGPQNTGNVLKTSKPFPRTQNYPVPYPYASTSTVSTTTKAQLKRDIEPSSKDSKNDQNDGDLKVIHKTLGDRVQNATRQNDAKLPVISIQ